jgi:hypothetical protein
MKLNGTFGTSELSPWEKGQTKGYDGAVWGKEFVFESKFVFSRSRFLIGIKGLIK